MLPSRRCTFRDTLCTGGFVNAPINHVVLSGGAVSADAGAIDPVRPSGAARGGGDRATAFDAQEHFVLLGSAFDPRGTTEGA